MADSLSVSFLDAQRTYNMVEPQSTRLDELQNRKSAAAFKYNHCIDVIRQLNAQRRRYLDI